MLPVRASAARLPRKHILRIGCFFMALLGVSLYGATRSALSHTHGGDASRRLSELGNTCLGKNCSGIIKPDTCTAHCEPWGGPLSMMGAMSGQCDCEYKRVAADANSPWDASGATFSCEYQDNKAYSCCGKLDPGSFDASSVYVPPPSLAPAVARAGPRTTC